MRASAKPCRTSTSSAGSAVGSPNGPRSNPEDKSLGQYVGQVTGSLETKTVNDCTPSETCNTTDDNLFRQIRTSGRKAVNYVEGATAPCSDDGNKAKHIPALYLWGDDDRAHCSEQVRPFTEFDPNRLPAFAFVTPTLCNDGHDCGDQVVDTWARDHVQPVLDSAAYRAGKVAVFIWYDESAPVPNMWMTPTARPGARSGSPAVPRPPCGRGNRCSTCRAWPMRAPRPTSGPRPTPEASPPRRRTGQCVRPTPSWQCGPPQCSTILPSRIRRIAVPLIVTGSPEGATP